MFLSSGSGVVLGIYLCLVLSLHCYSPQRGIKKGARLCLPQSFRTDSHPRSLDRRGPVGYSGGHRVSVIRSLPNYCEGFGLLFHRLIQLLVFTTGSERMLCWPQPFGECRLSF